MSSLHQEIYKILDYNGLMEIRALHRKGTRKKVNMCFDLHTFSNHQYSSVCSILNRCFCISWIGIFFLIKSNKRWCKADGVDILDIKKDLEGIQT